MRIACLHTAASNISVFETAAKALVSALMCYAMKCAPTCWLLPKTPVI